VLKKTMKEAAEAALNELPSVIGAFVREDSHGQPREVHLLVGPTPDVRHLARDVRSYLEERLGVTVDQRVISIAQMVDPTEAPAATAAALSPAAAPARSPAGPSPHAEADDERIIFRSAEARVRDARVEVTVILERDGQEYAGTAEEIESLPGRARASAMATLRALVHAVGGEARLDLESASIVSALDSEFVVATVLATNPRGRRPLGLVGAHGLDDDDAVTAAALAVLKAVNRLASRAGRQDGRVRRPRDGSGPRRP
jgi:hypothetical protein